MKRKINKLFILLIFALFGISNATIYYVAQCNTAASDNNTGTEASPFKTISCATQRMLPGDICYVKEGIYREAIEFSNSGTLNNPISLLKYGNDEVIISGLDTLDRNAVQNNPNGTKTIQISQEILPQINRYSQLFINCKEMVLSRWPNVDDYMDISNLPQMTSVYVYDDSDNTKDFATFKSSKLYNTDNIIVNKSVLCYNGWDQGGTGHPYWTSCNIIGKTSTTLKIGGKDLQGDFKPVDGTKFYIVGGIETLDANYEYCITDEGYLNFIAPIVSGPIEIRTRRYVVEADGYSYINIEGFDIVGGSINFKNCSNVNISNCNIQYPTPFYFPNGQQQNQDITWGATISGTNNVIEDCIVAHSWGDGITISNPTSSSITSSNNNIIRNCIIYDIGRAGTCSGGIAVGTDLQEEPGYIFNYSALNNTITGNTIFNCGKYGINHQYSQNTEITFNDVSNCGLITEDGGITHGHNSSSAEIAYNWIHGIKDIGIYADDAPENYYIHHNVIYNCYTGINIHGVAPEWGGAENVRIEYNTIITGLTPIFFQGQHFNNVSYTNNIIIGQVANEDDDLDPNDPNDGVTPGVNYTIPGSNLAQLLDDNFPNMENNDFHPISSIPTGMGAYNPTDNWKAGATITGRGEPFYWFKSSIGNLFISTIPTILKDKNN